MGKGDARQFCTEEQKQFYKELVAAGRGSKSPLETFEDACRVFALTLHNPLLKQMGLTEEYERYEEEHISIMKRYGDAGKHIANAFAILVQALEAKREDFLGQIMERIGATDKYKDQFFTPIHISDFMAKIACFDSLDENGEGGGALMEKVKRGELVTLNDPCCGASVLLIAGAEGLMQYGVPQSQIMLYAEDLGTLTFNVSYTQLSLLGYAAQVTRMDSLSMKIYEGPWHTFGFFAHGVPQRMQTLKVIDTLKELFLDGGDKKKSVASASAKPQSGGEEPTPDAERKPANTPAAARETAPAEPKKRKRKSSEDGIPTPPPEVLSKPFAAVGGTQLELDFGA